MQTNDANLTGQKVRDDEETAKYLIPPIKDQIHLLLLENIHILKVESEDEIESQLKGVVFVNRGRNIDQALNQQSIRQSYYKLMDSLEYKQQQQLRYFYLENYVIPQQQQEFESDFTKHSDYYLFETSPYTHYWNILKKNQQIPFETQTLLQNDSIYSIIKNSQFNYNQATLDFHKHKEFHPCKIQKYIKKPFLLRETPQVKFHVAFKVYLFIESLDPIQSHISNKVLVILRSDPQFIPTDLMQDFYSQKVKHLSDTSKVVMQHPKIKETITFEEFKERLLMTYVNFDETKFWKQISEQSILMLIANYPNIQFINDKTYQILQLSFTMDDQMDLWLCKKNLENELQQKIEKQREIQRTLFKKIDIERMKIKSAQKQVISYKEINQCLTSRLDKNMPLYYQHKKEFQTFYNKAMLEIHSDFDIELAFRKIFQQHCYSLDSVKNRHPALVKIDDDEWVQKWLIKLLYHGGENRRSKSVIKGTFLLSDNFESSQNPKQNKFRRFLRFLMKRIQKKELASNQGRLTQQISKKNEKQEETSSLGEDEIMHAINQYKRRKYQQRYDQNGTINLQKIQTSKLSEYFDDEYEVKIPQKEKWIKDLDRNHSKSSGQNDFIESELSFEDLEDQDRKDYQNAIDIAQMAQKLGILKGREKAQAPATQSRNRKQNKLFFGLNYSSSSNDSKEDILAYKAKNVAKLEQLKTNVQSVMKTYNINHNMITYNLTENENDLKLRTLQKNQSQQNLRERLKSTLQQNSKQILPKVTKDKNQLTQYKNLNLNLEILRDTNCIQSAQTSRQNFIRNGFPVKLTSVTPRQPAIFQSDYLTEQRIIRDLQNGFKSSDKDQLNIKEAARGQTSMQNQKLSRLRQTIQKMLLMKKKQRIQSMSGVQSMSQMVSARSNLSSNLENRNTLKSGEMLHNQDLKSNYDTLNRDLFLNQYQIFKHFTRLLPFNAESETIVKDLDQLAIKFNYFELVLITKRVYKQIETFDFYEQIKNLEVVQLDEQI
eukprot:403373761